MTIFTDRATARGNLVSFDGFSVSIIIECVGLLEMLIYSACVLAFPAPWRARLLGVPLALALGIVLLSLALAINAAVMSIRLTAERHAYA